MRRIVVTGLGLLSPVGLNKDDSFDAIVGSKCGVNLITHFDTSAHFVKIAAEVKDFNPEDVFDKKDIKKTDRFIHFGMKSAMEAMKDASFDKYDALRFGVSSSSGIGGLPNIETNSVVCKLKGAKRITPFFIPSALVNMLGGYLSIRFDLKGPNISSVTACAASTHAISSAAKTIMLNQADIMLVVGAEGAICPVGIAGFSSMRALSRNNDNPQKASRPFDYHRDGFVMGEGSGALVLEEYSMAKSRGAKIYCELKGFGETSDAHHITSPPSNGDGAYRAMKLALNMADIDVVDYINAHGTSTKYNDLYETIAIKNLFKDKKTIPPVSSIKGSIGHCLGASGAMETVISIISLNRGIMPPTINYETKDLECDLDYVPNIARRAKIDSIMTNSFGFGGTNGSLIFIKCGSN